MADARFGRWRPSGEPTPTCAACEVAVTAAVSPGGNPERFLVTTGTLPTFACVGVGFAPDGDLAVVTGVFNRPAVRFWRDRNGDGDFADADESQVVAKNGSDVQRLGVAHDPSGNAYLATTGDVGAKLIYLDPGAP